jgi:hypothetical protein
MKFMLFVIQSILIITFTHSAEAKKCPFKDGVYRAIEHANKLEPAEMGLYFRCIDNDSEDVQIFGMNHAGEASWFPYFERIDGKHYTQISCIEEFKLNSDGTFYLKTCDSPVGSNYKWRKKIYVGNSNLCGSTSGSGQGFLGKFKADREARDNAQIVCSRKDERDVISSSIVYYRYGKNVRGNLYFTSFRFCCTE